MLARTFEAAGLATVSVSLVREHTVALKPPRALYVPFPFGMPLGRPGDAAQQTRVLRAVFGLLDAGPPPVLRDLGGEETVGDASPVQAARVAPAAAVAVGDVAAEVTRMRHFHERWAARTGRTSVGLTGIAPERFRGVVRFLEAYARGEDADLRARPPDVPVAYFVRYCVDDLRALYAEAWFVRRPDAPPDEFHRWLWGESALGGLLRAVRDRMAADGDATTRAVAYGIAR